jgi:hypothetical protein
MLTWVDLLALFSLALGLALGYRGGFWGPGWGLGSSSTWSWPS